MPYKDAIGRSAARQRWRDEFNDYKKTLKCLDCGIQDYRVLQFHHREGVEKDRRMNIPAMVATRNVSRLEAELKKCEVLCANCHVIRHFEENNDRSRISPAHVTHVKGDSL